MLDATGVEGGEIGCAGIGFTEATPFHRLRTFLLQESIKQVTPTQCELSRLARADSW